MAARNLKDLVQQLQNGNMSVFDDIYYETKNIVFYTILSIIKDYSASEDLMQETYLKALEKIHTYKPKGSFKSWIVTVARNLALNEYKKRKRELMIDPQTDEYIFGSTQSNSEQQLIIEEMLKKLKDKEQEIVILHVIGDMKHKEIAKLLNMPLGTVTWTYSEAMKKLKSDYESR